MSDNYKTEYQKLNQQQRQAVDAIEGPVMVIAGAGTGKTQTIAVRIANILKKTQTEPQNILCLTFTDSAAANMRSRLLSIIGTTAYQVKIHTFHSFCNEVILTNPDYFVFAPNIKPIDQLGQIEIVQKLISALPTRSAIKPWGDPLFYQSQILSLIQTFKRENVSPLYLKKLIHNQSLFLKKSQTIQSSLSSLRANKDLATQVTNLNQHLIKIAPLSLKLLFHSQQNLFDTGAFASGRAKSEAVNFKNALLKIIDDLVKQTPKQLDLLKLYRLYQKSLKTEGLYDFDDMILFCIKAFKKQPDLLKDYQEKFLYLLVDEYQDSNSSQNQILHLLTSYDPKPNLFVVGDDDQSIFRFQGASLENIYTFYQTYQPQLIVLKNNYRSHQLILDTSANLIQNNQNRIASLIANIDKSLISQTSYDPDPINLFVAPNYLQENYYVANRIKKLINSGTNPSQIAILTRTNAESIDIQHFLSTLSVAYQTSSGNNVLDQIHIQQLIKLLKLILKPSSDRLFYDVLSADFIGIKPLTIFKLTQAKKPLFSHFKSFTKKLAVASHDLANLSFDRAFVAIIHSFGYLDYLVKQDDFKKIQDLQQFFDFLRQNTDSGLSLKQVLKKIDLMVQNQISIQATSPPDPGAVQIMTVHKAKGLEFEHVFIPNLVDGHWGNNRAFSPLKTPYGILKTEITSQITDQFEEERRLFYVALTRAKRQIYLSYSQQKNKGRNQLPSLFLSEIDSKLIELVSPPANLGKHALTHLFSPQLKLDSDHQSYLLNYLKNDYKFNVTHLNSYLKCPLCFYYKTILRIPQAKDKYLSLGTAVHHALRQLHDQYKKTKTLISQQQFIKIFTDSLISQHLPKPDYRSALDIGLANLPDYYQCHKSDFCDNCISEYDFAKSNVFLKGIPITGKIDRIQPLGLNTALVFDYKTGNPDTKSITKNSDYFRQLVFYKILSQNSPGFKYDVVGGIIDFIQKSKKTDHFIQKKFDFTDSDIKDLTDLIVDTYQKILNLEFNHIGSDCKDADHLHDLVKTT